MYHVTPVAQVDLQFSEIRLREHSTGEGEGGSDARFIEADLVFQSFLLAQLNGCRRFKINAMLCGEHS